jgi:succinoglycan biosynthesis transport protein ExoP
MDQLQQIKSGYSDQVWRSGSITDLLEQCMGFIRRQYPIFAIIMLCAFAAGFAYLIAVPAQYTAKAILLIDSNKVRILQPQQQALGDAPLDSDQVETQVEILKSEKIAQSVIEEQRLAESPESLRTEDSLFGALRNYLSPASASQSEPVLMRNAVQALLQRRTITRIGRTSAVVIGVTSPNPESAAAIANGIAEAYIHDQLQSKYEATQRATDWLQDRIKELEARALAADRSVLEFKEEKKIVDIGGEGGAGVSGRLIGDRQLAELSTQLTTARVATGEAKARLDRIDDVMKREIDDATVTDSLKDEVITRLRNQYLDMAALETTWSNRYGYEHQAAVNLRNQMQQLRRSIRNELGRIAAGYNSDYEIAKAREQSLEEKFAGLVAAGQVGSRDRLGLIDLESSAKVYHTIYDNFLQLSRQAIQQQSFPIAESRLLSPAEPPAQKSSPIGSLVLSIAGFLGLVASLGVAALREASDSTFRTARQVEDALRVPCLAMVPVIKQEVSTGLRVDPDLGTGRRASRSSPRARIGRGSQMADASRGTAVSLTNALMRHVIEEPFSAFAEGLRAVKVRTELSAVTKRTKVIGVTSTVPNEGKSTVACNLAELMADAGKRVILVDADLRKPTLARYLNPKPVVGLLEVLDAQSDLQQALSFDAETGLTFLPSGIDTQLAHSDEVLSSEALRNLVDRLRQQYDFIILDLPPLAPVVDVRAATQIIDAFILVVEWGRSRIRVVQDHVSAEPEVYERLLGVVLNKVDAKTLTRYQGHYGKLYGYQSYSLHERGVSRAPESADGTMAAQV